MDDLLKAIKKPGTFEPLNPKPEPISADANLQQFLNAISMIESSGGINTDHPEMKSGIHAGDSAIGTYGLMPNTVNETINRMRLAGELSPELKELSKLPEDQMMQQIKSNSDYENKLAEYLGSHVLNKQGGDEEKAAYSWFMGHNMSPEKIDKSDYKNSDYVKKYNKFRNIDGLLKKN